MRRVDLLEGNSSRRELGDALSDVGEGASQGLQVVWQAVENRMQLVGIAIGVVGHGEASELVGERASTSCDHMPDNQATCSYIDKLQDCSDEERDIYDINATSSRGAHCGHRERKLEIAKKKRMQVQRDY